MKEQIQKLTWCSWNWKSKMTSCTFTALSDQGNKRYLWLRFTIPPGIDEHPIWKRPQSSEWPLLSEIGYVLWNIHLQKNSRSMQTVWVQCGPVYKHWTRTQETLKIGMTSRKSLQLSVFLLSLYVQLSWLDCKLYKHRDFSRCQHPAQWCSQTWLCGYSIIILARLVGFFQ